jgi:hypothetical protein
MKKDRSLDAGYVRSLLSYNKDTGDFTWLVSRGNIKNGKRAGSPSLDRRSSRSYYKIKIDKKLYGAHKLAWLIHYGEWPDMLDHIDGDSLNNRISNLRKCDMSENKANSRLYKNNSSGAKGVSRRGKHWRASVQVGGKRIQLGTFDTFEAASGAYASKAIEVFGAFARIA